jgi:hypothetical protein
MAAGLVCGELLRGAEDPDEGGVHNADEESGDSGSIVGKVPGGIGMVPRSKAARCQTQRAGL